jgi:hypothetical protein
MEGLHLATRAPDTSQRDRDEHAAGVRPRPGDWCFGIEVVNRDLEPIEIRSAGFDMNDGSGGKIIWQVQPPGATLPGVVKGRSSASTWLPIEELEKQGLDIYGPIVAWVRTEADELVRSEPKTLYTK